MENKTYYKIRLNDLDDVLRDATEQAMLEHPKQRRRRFEAANEYVLEGISSKGETIQAEELTPLHPVAVVYARKVNLGTKKWADYRTNYATAYGTIEKETAASVKIRGYWYKKEKIIALVTQREVARV